MNEHCPECTQYNGWCLGHCIQGSVHTALNALSITGGVTGIAFGAVCTLP